MKSKKKSLSSKRFRTLFSFHRIERTKNLHYRLDGYNKKNKEQKKLAENLDIGKNVL